MQISNPVLDMAYGLFFLKHSLKKPLAAYPCLSDLAYQKAISDVRSEDAGDPRAPHNLLNHVLTCFLHQFQSLRPPILRSASLLINDM